MVRSRGRRKFCVDMGRWRISITHRIIHNTELFLLCSTHPLGVECWLACGSDTKFLCDYAPRFAAARRAALRHTTPAVPHHTQT